MGCFLNRTHLRNIDPGQKNKEVTVGRFYFKTHFQSDGPKQQATCISCYFRRIICPQPVWVANFTESPAFDLIITQEWMKETQHSLLNSTFIYSQLKVSLSNQTYSVQKQNMFFARASGCLFIRREGAEMVFEEPVCRVPYQTRCIDGASEEYYEEHEMRANQ